MSFGEQVSYTLNNGAVVPALGLGTWKSKPGEVRAAVREAIRAGYRHLDCAHAYQNEAEVGEAIADEIAAGTIKREDLFVTSKLWNTFHRPDLVETACRVTLKNLGIDRLDLYLIHWPQAYKEGDALFPLVNDKLLPSDVDYVDTWKEMEKLVQAGLVRSIGVSNFNSQQITRVLEVATIKPVTNQVECHPYLTQHKLSEFCRKLDILITAYSPLGSPDRPWAKPTDPQLLHDPKLKSICEKYNKTPAQILIRYQIERGHLVMPKSVTEHRIRENFQVFDFKLDKDDMSSIDSFNINERFCPENGALGHKYHPFENTEF